MTDRWRIEIGRVVVRGMPPGPLDESRLRALVAGGVRARLRDAALPSARRASTDVLVQAPPLVGDTGAVAETVANAVASTVMGGPANAGHGRG